MNREDIIRMAQEAKLLGEFDTAEYIFENGVEVWISGQRGLDALEKFAALVASAEREVWEHKYARLQSLMDIRETQPNKPCCLAEREACAKVCEDAPEPDGADLAERIRARGQA